MKELQGVLEALARLTVVLGPGWTMAIFLLLVGYHELREWRKGHLERSIADEKEAQIQRIADDNRWMRRILMSKVMGFTADETERLMGDGQPTPILSDPRRKK